MDLGNLKTNIKRFFSNPNTVTFLLVLGLIVVVYFVYQYLVNKAISPVSVPYCTQELKSRQEITSDSIGTIKISGNFVTASGSGLIQTSKNVEGKYVNNGYLIPENSFFYQSSLADAAKQSETYATNMPDNYALFTLEVDFHSTYGCSIMPGNYIDLYYLSYDKEFDDKLIYGLFIKSIEVRAVLDSKGLDVFTESEKDKVEPKYLLFAVPNEYFELLTIAKKVSGSSIIPVPRNAGYSENPEPTTLYNDAIESYILANASAIQ